MVEIESSIGKVHLKDKPVRKFVVDDPTLQAEEQVPEEELDPLIERRRLIQMQRQRTLERLRAEGKGQSEEEAVRTTDTQESDIKRYEINSTENVMQIPKMGTNDEIREMERLQAMKKVKDKISPENKARIELLLGLGVRRTKVDIDGHIIGLKSLSNLELKNTFKRTILLADSEKNKNIVNLESNYTLRNVTLAYSLESIDGKLISEILEEQANIEDARLNLIEGMSEDVLIILSKEYEKISSRKAEISSKDDGEEVVKEIKK